jgi:hypothetical protein
LPEAALVTLDILRVRPFSFCGLRGKFRSSMEEPMNPKIIITLYKPHPGNEKELEDRITHHIEALLELGAVSFRPRLVFKSSDGTYLELLEWIVPRGESPFRSLREFKDSIKEICEFKTLADLPEADDIDAEFKEVIYLSETYSAKGSIPPEHVRF